MPQIVARQMVGLRKQVDHAPEQDGVKKLQTSHHQIGRGQEARNPDVTSQKAQNTSVHTKEPHLSIPAGD